jgi:Tail tubular protein
MSISAMSELEAVNLMLTTIGEAPVNTIEGSNMLDVAIARQVLKEVLIEVCETGWHFNTEKDIVITPTTAGEIYLPPNALRADTMDEMDGDVVMRGRRLYDKAAHTYTFTRSISLEIVFGLMFEEVPQVVRQYVAIRAARKFQRRMVTSDLIEKLTEQEEVAAYIKLKDFDSDTADYNMLDNPHFQRILAR